MGHNRHTHDDSERIANARYYRHCNVQISRCAKERKSDEFSLSKSGNAISDTDTYIPLVVHFWSRLQIKVSPGWQLGDRSGNAA